MFPNFVSSILISLFSGLAAIFIAKRMGPNGRGIMSLAQVWGWTALLLIHMGLGHSATVTVSRERQIAKRVWGMLLGASIFLGLISAAITVPLAIHWSPAHAKEAIVPVVLGVPLALLTYYQIALLQGMGGQTEVAMSRLAQPLIWFVAVLGYLLTGGQNPITLAVLLTVSQGVSALFIFLRVRRILGSPGFYRPPRSFLTFGSRVWAASIARGLSNRFDIMMLGALGSVSTVGLYAAGAGLAALLAIIPISVALVTLPEVSSRKMQDGLRVGARYVFLAGLACTMASVGLFIAAPSLIPFTLGKSFVKATPTFRILLIAQIPSAMSHVMHEIANGIGKPHIPAWTESFTLVILVPTLFYGIKKAGFMGAAWAMLLISLLNFLILVLALYRERDSGNPP